MSESYEEVWPTYKVYARTNEDNVVTRIFSSIFETPKEKDTFIEEGHEQYHAHTHLKWSILTEETKQYRYKIVDNQLIERTSEELQAEIDAMPKPIPSTTERLNQLEEAYATIMYGGE